MTNTCRISSIGKSILRYKTDLNIIIKMLMKIYKDLGLSLHHFIPLECSWLKVVNLVKKKYYQK